MLVGALAQVAGRDHDAVPDVWEVVGVLTVPVGASQAPHYSQYVINRLPQDDDELWWTVFGLFGYRIPRVAVCPNHVAPFTAFAEAYFARYPMTIWKASRGLGGKSRTLAVLGMTEAVLLGCEVNVLGGSGGQSKNVHDATKTAWDWHAAPKGLLNRPPTTFDTVLTNGGHMRTLTASQTSVRGPHPPRLRMDEIDEMDQDILDAALGQPMEQMNYLGQMVETQVVMSSTHQYPDKTMSEMIRRAKEEGWPVREWCFRESANKTDGWLTDKAIARAKSMVSKVMWETEYELQEPSFAGRAIDTEMVEKCFDPAFGEHDANVTHVTLQRRHDGRHYLTAIDWAKTRDWTIVATFDTTDRPWVCVSWTRFGRMPWPIIVKRAMEKWREYGDRLIHDATGLGTVITDLIKADTTTSEQKKVIDYTMGGGRDRDAFYTDYIAAIEHEDITYPRIHWAYDEHRYVTNDDLFTGKGHAPDSVVVGALAWSARKRGGVKIGMPGGGTRASSPWSV